MRYLPTHDLFFVHIPKNGGQSVRNAMVKAGTLSFAPLAEDLGIPPEQAAEAAESGIEHPELGMIHPAHLPLWVMAAYFPQSWQTFQSSHSLALTRDPRDRFFSALMQRLKEFRGAGQIRADDPMVAEEAARVCGWLDQRPRHADLEYVHFIRQQDFVDLDGTRMVNAVFPMNAMGAVAAWTEQACGFRLEVGHDHARRQPKAWAKRIQPVARFAGRKLMPRTVKRALHPLWMSSGVFANAAQGYRDVSLGDDTEAFIAQYYAADAALHAEAQAAATAQLAGTAA
ncbi:hypothetical protein KUV62_14885 [Salipiger bermudensis]|uniref:hypothetical protein n=1 Tax=Salipiger bermudensis TaxID=344736 RepID=UPI001C9957A5|nr:hypothetical protein [Salipiger bermudensis]MBY6005207.1 hypothetical protein [Salipiger bermudensis]